MPRSPRGCGCACAATSKVHSAARRFADAQQAGDTPSDPRNYRRTQHRRRPDGQLSHERAEWPDLDNRRRDHHRSRVRPERISRDGHGQRSSRSATGVPERERTERRLGAGEGAAEPGSWRSTDRSLMRPAGRPGVESRCRPPSFPEISTGNGPQITRSAKGRHLLAGSPALGGGAAGAGPLGGSLAAAP